VNTSPVFSGDHCKSKTEIIILTVFSIEGVVDIWTFEVVGGSKQKKQLRCFVVSIKAVLLLQLLEVTTAFC
jgi:hypothetical protein